MGKEHHFVNTYVLEHRAHKRADGSTKKRYSEAQARRLAEQYPTMSAYKCPRCPAWHVGNTRNPS